MRRLGAALLCAGLWAGASVAAPCRQALVLGLDVSGSVDAVEYRQQLDGLAGALMQPQVQAALLALPGAPMRLAVFEWSGPDSQRLVLDWVTLDSAAVLAGVADDLRQVQRVPMDVSTAIGAAKRYGDGLLAGQRSCWRRVLDLSGDGPSNTGPRPQDSPMARGVVVNGLVIGAEGGLAGPLAAYYRAHVITGPDAFVEEARDFADYQEAMARKLLREVPVMVLGARE